MGSNSSKLEDKVRENKRTIKRTIRDLERQKLSAQRQEESLVSMLKEEARSGRMKNARLLARDVIRNRKLADHLCNMKSQMTALQSQLQTAHNTSLLSNSFKNVSDLMTQVNCNTNVAEFQKIMANITQQGAVLNLKVEMMGDAMEDSLDFEDTIEEEKAVDKLLEDLGVGVGATLDSLNPPKMEDLTYSTGKNMEEVMENNSGRMKEMMEIEERINNLKN
ncbi:uncharacterized protein TA14445 [Theileria annulata]|uniref:SNF7 family protein n=1 Tax=Theileria annulata TaxID=5874 RepID=Q4UF21_THEAN|nr:uncharacterized protein TA14445 [Theileria annulata]CAI74318.1 hypothetical protein, conserved [Theileria annulata]|eukprot:XP_952050.1 hypothetical protein, conserved [Theileria annulata]